MGTRMMDHDELIANMVRYGLPLPRTLLSCLTYLCDGIPKGERRAASPSTHPAYNRDLRALFEQTARAEEDVFDAFSS